MASPPHSHQNECNKVFTSRKNAPQGLSKVVIFVQLLNCEIVEIFVRVFKINLSKLFIFREQNTHS